MRGTFANVRLRNKLVEREGGFTKHFPDGEETTIYDAAMRYADEGVPLVVLAGKEYGSGSSRDWAAKGTKLLGVRAVIAESFERIHRSNLIGMGVVPLQFPDRRVGRLARPHRRGDVLGIGDLENGEAKSVTVTARREGADPVEFEAKVRLDTPNEVRYFQNGGILHRVLRDLRSGLPRRGSRPKRGGAAGPREAGGPRDPHHACASVAREGCRRGPSPEAGLAGGNLPRLGFPFLGRG